MIWVQPEKPLFAMSALIARSLTRAALCWEALCRRALCLVALCWVALFCLPLMAAEAAGEEILMIHLSGSAKLSLEGGMISPGRYRAVSHPPAEQSFQLELLDDSGSVLTSQHVPDSRQVFAEMAAAGQTHVLPAADGRSFSLRLPWISDARRLRVRDGAGTLLLDVPLSDLFVRRARDRYKEVLAEISGQEKLVRRSIQQAPARIENSVEIPELYELEARDRSARDLETARLPASRAVAPADSGPSYVTVSVRVLDVSGQPVTKAGVVLLDASTGLALGGADTNTEGRANLNIADVKARLYVFPPFILAGVLPTYARKIVEIDLKTSPNLDITLEPGVLVTGQVTRAEAVPGSNFSVTAVDASTNQSIEYARTDANGFFRLRVPPGQYRFYVGPRPGFGLLVSDARDIGGDQVQADFRVAVETMTELRGKVVAPGGQPIAGGRVVVFDKAANTFASLTTATDGSFSGTAPQDGFVFVYPNSSTAFQSVTRNVSQLAVGQDIVLPKLPEIQTPDPSKPLVGLVYGDASDSTRLNMVLIGDGYTDLKEDFTDSNSNGRWDGDVYLDENKNGSYDSGEQFFNRDGVSGYQPPEPFVDTNGDGYRNNNEQALFDRNLLDYVRVLLGTSPWPDLLSRINFWRIRTVSPQTAGNFAEFEITRDTALRTSYGPKATGFIISVSSAVVNPIVQVLIPEFDHVMIVSNSPLSVGRANANFGGNLRLKGGDFDNLSTVATHELGHVVGFLADEYSDSTIIDTAYIYKFVESTRPNISTSPFANLTKWAAELDGTPPYPTPPDLGGVGIFEGGNTNYRGMYRPEYNCMMRHNTPRFCVVCNREMRARIIARSSTDALVFPLLAFNDNAVAGERLLTAFSAVNPDPARHLALGYTAYNTLGKLLLGRTVINPALRELGPLRQEAALDREIFGFTTPQSGWVEAASNGPGKGFYLIADSSFSEKVDGAAANPEAASDLAIPFVPSGQNTKFFFSVVNPDTRSSGVIITYFNATGGTVGTQTTTILSKGQLYLTPPTGTAWIRARSTTNPPVALRAAAFHYDATTLAVQSGAALNKPVDSLIFPHYAVGGGYETRLVISSLSNAVFHLEARRSDGSLAGAAKTQTFQPGQQLSVSVRDFFGLDPGSGIDVGYIVATNPTAGPIALQGVAGLTYFTYGQSAVADSAAVSQAETTPKTTLTFSHVANDVPAGGGRTFLTGITLVNSGSADARFKIRYFRKNGEATQFVRDMVLPAGQKISRLLSGDSSSSAFFEGSLSAGEGYLVVTSDQPLFGFELFFTNDLKLLASVPAQ
ncbi:MAG: M64 family metallopeptidase [Acidobacteriota bacterium]